MTFTNNEMLLLHIQEENYIWSNGDLPIWMSKLGI